MASRRGPVESDDAELARADSSGAELLALPEARGNFEDADCRRSLIVALVGCRNSMSLTQEAVAERMGTTQSAISELEAGGTDPRLSTLQRYGRAVESRVLVHLVSAHQTTFRIEAQTTVGLRLETLSKSPEVVLDWKGLSFALASTDAER